MIALPKVREDSGSSLDELKHVNRSGKERILGRVNAKEGINTSHLQNQEPKNIK